MHKTHHAPMENQDLDSFHQERDPAFAEPEGYDQPVRRRLLTAIAPRATAVGEGASPTWQPVETPSNDGRFLILEDP